MIKTFEGDFFKFLNKIKIGENFSFGRFSDGELCMLKNVPLSIDSKATKINNVAVNNGFTKEDHKNFDPIIHMFYRNKLIEALKFRKNNYIDN